LLLRLTVVATESDLPPIWDAWAICNKKESRIVLQEHLRDNARVLGLPEPIATEELTMMLSSLAFNSMHEDDLESGLQPFIVSYKDQQTIAKQQRVNKDYDMVQHGPDPILSPKLVQGCQLNFGVAFPSCNPNLFKDAPTEF
jgi:hypothetical protein